MRSSVGKEKISSAAQRPEPSAFGEQVTSTWSAPVTSQVTMGMSRPA